MVYHAMPRCATLCNAVPCCAVQCCACCAVLFRALQCCIVLVRCCAVLCRAVPCCVVLYRAVSCCTVLCRAEPCCAVTLKILIRNDIWNLLNNISKPSLIESLFHYQTECERYLDDIQVPNSNTVRIGLRTRKTKIESIDQEKNYRWGWEIIFQPAWIFLRVS